MNIFKCAAASLALGAALIGQAEASTYCSIIHRLAHATAQARDNGVSRERIDALLEANAGGKKVSVEVLAIADAAYYSPLASLTPDGFAYKIEKACEANKWEEKYGD